MRFTAAGRELIDTLDAVRRHDFVARDLPGHGLKQVARHFGIAAKDRVYLPGSAIAATYARDPDRVRRYALDDVAEVDALSRRLLQAPFALAGMAPRRYERLASAGPATGVLEPILVRAYVRARVALPLPEEGGAELGPHAGGALYLFASGVAERVVKADIASLYPSLMTAFRIGPASDRLGALLHVVGSVLEKRLAHKAAARDAPPGSPEGARHGAMAAAMKLLINSAYGYMGAGSLALFADRRAADEVTRRGREVLDTLVAALRARGVALIEADTDGVYFAVPEGFTEAEERALVAAVGAELPAGIHLEYEGRFAAMFSHEVKNYALLTPAGELILRGVALRSSRSEPFGEQFLREALRRLMAGDVPGVRASLLEAAAAPPRPRHPHDRRRHAGPRHQAPRGLPRHPRRPPRGPLRGAPRRRPDALVPGRARALLPPARRRVRPPPRGRRGGRGRRSPRLRRRALPPRPRLRLRDAPAQGVRPRGFRAHLPPGGAARPLRSAPVVALAAVDPRPGDRRPP